VTGAARSWRWPWQPQAGMVRVSKDAHIATLTAALRATELETEIRTKRAEADGYIREARARDLIDEQARAAGVRLTMADTEDLTSDLPQRADGGLHKAAFLALLGQRLQERQFGAHIPTTSSRNGDDRS